MAYDESFKSCSIFCVSSFVSFITTIIRCFLILVQYEAIQTWEKAPKHAYSTLTNLLLKGVTGKNKAQLMKERESKNGIDGLTSVELTSYQRLEDMVIAMINLNRGYSEIKELIFKV